MKQLSRMASVCVALMATSAWATPQLYTPWPCGTTYGITQGHNGGSHTDFGSWAWDVGIGVGLDVVAPADGTVRMVRMSSTSHGCHKDFANFANYVIIDFGDGTEALFLHLQAGSSSLEVGERVSRGQVVGKVGLSGWVCGAHLHFQIQQTCGSWWCQSVQASFVDYGDPGYGATLPSNNCGPPPSCDARLSGGTTLVDEQDAGCFERVTEYWWDVSEGHNGHHFYTFATDAAAVETYGRWKVGVDTPGDYRVEVYVPNTEASSQQATYTIHDGNRSHTSRAINQSSEKGWVELGVYPFAGGEERYVQLGDNTGENYNTYQRKVAFDAVRFTYLPPAQPDVGGEDTAPEDTGVADTGSVDASSGTDSGQADTSGGADGGRVGSDVGGELGSVPDVGRPGEDTSGADTSSPPELNVQSDCACALRGAEEGRSESRGWALSLLMGLLLLRRRL